MPGGVTAGEANIKLVPDLRGFAAEARAQLQRLESSLKATITANLKLDTAAARAELRNFAAQKIEVTGQFKTAEFLRDVRNALRDAQRLASANKIKVESDFDLNSATIRSRIAAIRGGKVTINVDLDVTGARAKAVIFRRFLDALFANIKIKLEIDNASVAAALAQLAAVAAAIQGLQGLLGSLRIGGGGGGGGIGDLIGGAPKLAAQIVLIVLAIDAAIVAASLLTALIVQLGGSILIAASSAITLTSGLVGLSAIIGGLIVGMQGIGDAFKGAFDATNVKELNKALAGLAPTAASFIKIIRNMKFEFIRVQRAVQQILFGGLDVWLTRASQVLMPTLIFALKSGATVANQFARSLLAAFAQPKTASDLRNTIIGIQPGLMRLAQSIQPLVQGFLSIANGASPAFNDALTRMAKGIAHFGDVMNVVGNSKEFGDFLDKAVTVMGQLFQIAGSVVKIITGITTAAAAGGVSFAPFTDMFKRLADFVASPAGQKGLAEFFSKAQDAVVKLVPAMEAIGKAVVILLDALVSLAPVFAEILSSTLPPLIAGFSALWDVIKPFAGEIALTLIGILVVVAALFLAVVSPILLVVAAVVAVNIAVSALIDWLISIGPSVGAFFVALGQGILNFAKSMGAFFSGLATNVGNFVRSTFATLVSWGTSIHNIIAGIMSAIGTFVSGMISAAGKAISGFVSGITSGAGKAIAAAKTLLTNVLNAVSAGVGQMVNIGTRIVQGLVSGILAAASSVASAAANLVKGAIQAAQNAVDIHSPSRVARDEVGLMIGLGIALGLEDSAARVNAAMTMLLDPLQAAQVVSSDGSATIRHLVSLEGSDVTLSVNGQQFDGYLDAKANGRDEDISSQFASGPRQLF